MAGEQFSLVWNSFPRNLSSGLYTLLTDEHLVDVTLAAEGQILRAHKLILSVCSTYFRELFKGNSCKHPIVILKDVNYRDLSAMLHFMYQGEVSIKQEDIASFLKVAETLQIKGLTKDIDKDKLAHDTDDLENLLRDEPVGDMSTRRSISHMSIEKQFRPPDKSQRSPEPNSSHNAKAAFSEDDRITSNQPNHPGSDMEPENVMNELHIFNERCENVEDLSNIREEPLDYTSDIGRTSRTKHEPLDYTSDVDGDPSYRNYPIHEPLIQRREDTLQRPTDDSYYPQDFVPNSKLTPYNSNCQEESLGYTNIEAALRGDFPYDPSLSKGRRTVKGIPGSSLPLETTLRVVSELSPTLRMERGKVIRMYSCPWCLRHFTRKENLKLHVRYIHGPLESLTCKLCGNKYKNSNSLRVHSYLYHNAKRNKDNKPPPSLNGNV
ncbi:zinc finger and BTB domain-containing protein 7C isoform X2 [Cephus cinctus]|nr:zinc finger and BTB domain-containing protein 7C isoform X2 [Cephus cinctus]XP_015602562.1 zinc finger and BTB domain-containing protein 7C isoform X2 [Cephus cinctus]